MFGLVKDSLEGKMRLEVGCLRSDGDGTGVDGEVEAVERRLHSSSWTRARWSVWCISMTGLIIS